MSQEQVQRLKEVCRSRAQQAKKRGNKVPVRDWAILHVALDAGLRASELCNLRIRDLLLHQGQSSIIVRKGKGDKKRGVAIGKELRRHLLDFLDWKEARREGTDPKDVLFASWRGGSPRMSRQAIYHVFKRWARRAGIPERFSIHSCRHTYASMLYKSSNYNLRLVQSQLGHSSIQTTQVYADVLNADAERAVNDLPQ
ncbi:MAG: tyrosine-type recombinase/integrase [Candidatus Bipolaricaulota bacterium]